MTALVRHISFCLPIEDYNILSLLAFRIAFFFSSYLLHLGSPVFHLGTIDL